MRRLYKLGEEKLSISRFALWGQADPIWGRASINEFTLFSSLDEDFTSPKTLGQFSAPLLDPGPVPVRTFEFDTVEARYVRLQIGSNHFGGMSPVLSISEVAFEGTPAAAPVTEPASILLLGVGLAGLLGFGRRKFIANR